MFTSGTTVQIGYVVASRISTHISELDPHEALQFAYKKNRGTETALLRVSGSVLRAIRNVVF